jgi:sigma-B regulation protein RsbQ
MGPASRRLNVRCIGAGAQTIVLGHGFGTDQTAWRHIAEWLSTRYRVVLFDLACSGAVDPDLFDLRRYRKLDGYADDLRLILSELGIERCIYLGHSVSGMVGLLAAWREPERFARIIMLGASPRYLNDAGYSGGFDAGGVEGIFDAISANYRDWAGQFAPQVVGPNLGALQEFSAGLLAMRPDVALCAAITIFRSDLRERLRGFPVPVLILQARDDPAVPMSVAEYMHRELPDSILDVIDTTGHLPHLSTPTEMIGVLERHL